MFVGHSSYIDGCNYDVMYSLHILVFDLYSNIKFAKNRHEINGSISILIENLNGTENIMIAHTACF